MTAKSLRIDVAYCIELGRVVDIQEACAEFFNQSKYTKFHFLCSDEKCRDSRKNGVRVTAVNHNRLPTERKQSPHYRVWDSHTENCYWQEMERALQEEDEPSPESNDAERARRRVARKVTRLVTKFIIPTEESEEGNGPRVASEIDLISKIFDARQRRQALRQYVRGLGSTATSLEDLVTCFEELKSLDELGQDFIVDGHGRFTFRQAFRQVKRASQPGFSVHYGGARFQIPRYGRGFVLRFIDPLEQKPITIYVSPDHIKSYRPSARMVRMIDQIESLPDPKPYLKVYWIGGLEKSTRGWSATFKTLAHVVLRLTPPKAKPPTGEAEGNLPDGNLPGDM